MMYRRLMMKSAVRAGQDLAIGLIVAAGALAPPTAAWAYDFETVERSIATLSPATQRNWERKAIAGDAIAQNVTGMAYKYGIGVAQSHVASVKWFRKAADQGEADAQFNLGRICESEADGMYRRSRAAPANDAEAVSWFRRSAEQGHRAAQTKLARILVVGATGVQPELVEAYKWLRIASVAGDPAASGSLRVTAAAMTEQQRGEGEALARAWLARQDAK